MMSTRGEGKDVGDCCGENMHKTYQFLARDETNKTLLSLHSAKQLLEYERVKLHGNSYTKDSQIEHVRNETDA